MYANRIPFTRDSTKGPKAPKKVTKKSTKPVEVESVIEEPAKLEVIDLVTEPAVELEPVSEEVADGNS
jgi:hypothetical protein